MPHKKQKRSIRLATQQAKGYNNPPSAADSLLPINSTTYHGEPLAADSTTSAGGGGGGTGVEKKNNKRRKPASGTAGGNTGNGDLSGMSKSAYRILNADKLRQEYHAEKKRKLAEEEALKNPQQKKKKLTATATSTTSLKPLPYESLSTFNRRVEQEMRSTINSTIAASKNVNKKTKEVLKDKKKLAKAGKGTVADDVDEEWGGIVEPEESGGTGGEAGDERIKYGKEKKVKPTPEESRDPFAKQPKKPKTSTTGSTPAEDDKEETVEKVPRGRTGKTEFDSAPLSRGLTKPVLAPPTLAKPARKGLLAKALSSASDGTAGSRLGAESGGGFAGLRLAGMEEPVGKNRLPVDPMMKALLDKEREKAVRIYRELKEQKFNLK